MKKYIITIFMISLFTSFVMGQNNTPTGFLKFEINTDSAYVVINNDFFEPLIFANGDSLVLDVGTYLINLSVPFDEPYTSYIPIYHDSTTILDHTFSHNITTNTLDGNIAASYFFNSNVMVLTDENSEIYFADKLISKGFAKFFTFEKKGNLTIKNPDFGSKKIPLFLKDNGVNIFQYYRRPTYKSARFLSFFPGASQLYKRQKIKSALIGGGFFMLGGLFIRQNRLYNEELITYKKIKKAYQFATSEEKALELGNKLEHQYNINRKIDNQRVALLTSSFLLYAFNIYDAFTSTPSGGYRKTKSLELHLSEIDNSSTKNFLGTIRYNF